MLRKKSRGERLYRAYRKEFLRYNKGWMRSALLREFPPWRNLIFSKRQAWERIADGYAAIMNGPMTVHHHHHYPSGSWVTPVTLPDNSRIIS